MRRATHPVTFQASPSAPCRRFPFTQAGLRTMLRNTLTALAVCSLAACSTSKYVPLNPTEKASLNSIEVRGWLPQDEMHVVAKSPGASAALGGGLIGAIIDSQVAKGRQADLHAITDPFYAAVDDVDFRSTFWAAMGPQVKSTFGDQVRTIKTNPGATDLREAKKDLEGMSPTQGMLVMHTRYVFADNYTNLLSSTSIDLYRGGNPTPIFSNVYHYKSRSPEHSHIGAWSAQQGKVYRAAVQEAAAATAGMLALDFKHPRVDGVDKDLPADLGRRNTQGQSALWPIGPIPPPVGQRPRAGAAGRQVRDA